ncbi:FAD-binding oxidoreductase [Nonomuraea sp. NPDC050663]|uniref:FAD-binding oxidoreductase n=1 Tax=Nonomuraea sp. NPDC050663 TaxID=3364370 RepID=UPI00379B0AA1
MTKNLFPGDDGFEAASRPWNLTVQQPVTSVAEVTEAAEVAELVRHARRTGAAIATQPNGHGASGSAGGAILLRTGGLDTVEVDPERRVARVGAGAKWGQVQAEAARHGLTGLPGSAPGVGVTGYLLGGGLSWFSRKFGFAAGSVLAFEVVDADGEQRRVSADSDPELFWALRGGGGDFAIVTALEIGLQAIDAVYGGRVMWPGQRAAEVLELFRALTSDAPEELTVWFNHVQPPGAPAMAGLDLAFYGPESEAKEVLARIDELGGAMLDTRGTLALSELGTITNDPVDPSPGLGRGELIPVLDERVVELVLGDLAPLIGFQLRHLGGALARPSDLPSGSLAEPYLLYAFGAGIGPELTEAVRSRLAGLTGQLGDSVSGRRPYTFLAPGDDAAQAFTGADLERLRELKRARDPQGVFRSNYPVLG